MRYPKLLLLAIGIVLSFNTYSQNKIKYVFSQDSIQLGIEMNDEGNYDRAIELFEKVAPGDTNYELAIYEKCLSLVNAERYDEAIQLCRTGITFKNENQAQFYNLLGTSYDLKEDPAKAVEVYTEAIDRFPMSYDLYYNRSVVHIAAEQYNEAYNDLKRSLEINPFHPGSHLALADLTLNEKQFAQSLMAIAFYLMLEPTTQRANDNLVKYNSAVSENIELQPKGLKFENQDAFAKANRLIESYAALRNDYDIPVKITIPFVKQLHLAIEQSLKISDYQGFWENYYLPFYEDIMQNEYFEPFVYRTFLSSGNKKHQSIISKNEDEIKEFIEYIGPKMKVLYGLHKKGYETNNEEIKYWFASSGTNLEAVGKVNAENNPFGQYKFYYTSGAISTTGEFNNEGNRNGLWTYFYPNGNIKGTNNYSDGALSGADIDYFENGQKSLESTFEKDLREGTTCVLNETGTMNRCMYHHEGKISDSLVYYYNNGNVSSWLPMKEGLIDGKAKYYHADGSLNSEITWEDDMRSGPYTSLYSNGAKEVEGNYESGSLNGKYVIYFPNGQISSEGTYSEGTKVGEWKHFYFDGKLQKTETFDEKGKANGQEENYDYNGYKTSSFDYSKGEIVSYKIYDRLGNVLHESTRKKGIFLYEKYTLDKVKTVEGNYTGEHHVGLWKYYDDNGTLTTEENYDDKGLLQGVWTSYYANGKTKGLLTYKNDTLNGYDVSYHDNGGIKAQGYNWKGKSNGTWESYYEDGSLKAKHFYVMGSYNGPQYHYDEAGVLQTIEYYDMGVFTKLEEYNEKGELYFTHKFEYPDAVFTKEYPNGQKISSIEMQGNYFSGNGTWWYGNGKVELKGQFVEGDRHGKWTWYFPNGKIKTEGEYLFGKKHGVWNSYFKNGKLNTVENYNLGELHGERIYYYYNGQMDNKVLYVNGQQNGKMYFYDEEGNIDHIRMYELGKIIGYSHLGPDKNEVALIPIENETAKVVSYFPNGKKSREYELDKGMFTGDYVEYNIEGNKRYIAHYENNNRNGKVTSYYPNGKTRIEQTYSNGLLSGETKHYYPSGKLKSKKNYLNNALHGAYEEFSEAGTLSKKYWYRGGSMQNEL